MNTNFAIEIVINGKIERQTVSAAACGLRFGQGSGRTEQTNRKTKKQKQKISEFKEIV